MTDQDAYLRLRAAEAWWRISGDTNRAVSVFCQLLRHTDGNVRWNAVMAVGRVSANAEEAVPLLAERLQKDSDKFVRTVCADVLGRMGEAARPAIPALLVAVRDDDYLVQTSSARALGILDPSLGIQAATE
jgi:HEAT repeat protein